MTLALLLTAQLAGAHAADRIDAIDIVTGPVGHAIEMSIGLVVPEGETASWVCHEAITSPGAIQAPRYYRGSDGSWFAGLRDASQGRDGSAAWLSVDGCSWEAPIGLGNRGVLEAAIDPLDPGHVAAVVRDTDGNTALFERRGDAFSPVVEVDGVVNGVRFGADGTLWAGVVRDEPELWHRPVGGDWSVQGLGSWTADPVRIGALSDEPAKMWIVADGTEGDTVFGTADSGATWTPVPGVDGQFIDAAWDGQDGAWVIINGDRLVHAPDGQLVQQRGIGVGWVDGAVWSTSHPEVTGWIAGIFDPVEPTAVWVPTDIQGPLACPADSDVARVCEPLWDELGGRLASLGQTYVPTDSGLGADGSVKLEKGCGCDQSNPSDALWLAWIAVLACRRR